MDVLNAAKLHPKFLNAGGSLGKTNSFAGVDFTNLTGGLFNSTDPLKGNNLGCIVYQLSAQTKPDILFDALNKLTDTIGSIIGPLSCPQLRAFDTKQLQHFPGYSQKPVYG